MDTKPTPAPEVAELLPAPTIASPAKKRGRPRKKETKVPAMEAAPNDNPPSDPFSTGEITPPASTWDPAAEAAMVTEMGAAAILALFPDDPMKDEEKSLNTAATAGWLTERGRPLISTAGAALAVWSTSILRRALSPAGLARARALFGRTSPVETPEKTEKSPPLTP